MNEKIRKLRAVASAAAVMLTGTAFAVRAEEQTAPESLRLMCLGDSITDGFWLPGGYRNTLCKLISENGLAEQIDFVGPNWGGDGYDPQHAGYSGYSIDNIAQEDSISGARTGISSFSDWLMETYPADVVFMQIGTNDILSLYDLEHFGERLDKLVDSVLTGLPEDGVLYLATLPAMDATNTLYISEYFFTVESMDEAVNNCNAQIRALAEKKQAEGKNVRLAEINQVLTKDDLYDGVHPSEAGYQKMGNFWYARLNEYLSGETQPETSETAAETTVTVPETTTTEPETTVTSPETTEPPAPELLRGDLDGDSEIRIADVVLLAKHLSTAERLSEEQAARADMDTNSLLNAADLTLLKRAL